MELLFSEQLQHGERELLSRRLSAVQQHRHITRRLVPLERLDVVQFSLPAATNGQRQNVKMDNLLPDKLQMEKAYQTLRVELETKWERKTELGWKELCKLWEIGQLLDTLIGVADHVLGPHDSAHIRKATR